MTEPMQDLDLEIDREEDGRWIAEIAELPGVLAYGPSRPTAIARARQLARLVIAERQKYRDPDSCED